MRKIISFLLMLSLMISIACAETGEVSIDSCLRVGTTATLTGNFFTDLWGANAGDVDVRQLLHGYSLICWDEKKSMFCANPTVVTGMTGYTQENGDVTYTMMIADDLYYSDGTQIDAADYAFSMLLSASPQIAEIGGVTTKCAFIKGYEDYSNGNSECFEGVRILGKRKLSVTVSAEFEPCYYELAQLRFNPYPIKVIAPGCIVADDGEGAYITGANGEEKGLTAELLRETILDTESGYAAHPTMVSGPYVLKEFDRDAGIARFSANTFYKGDEKGRKPSIGQLELKTIQREKMVSALNSGEIDLVTRAVSAEVIDAGKEIAESEDYNAVSYPRSGLTMISYNCEKPAVNDAIVRRAVYMCLNKQALAENTVGAYGVPVNGYYGIDQWTYRVVSGELKPNSIDESELMAFDALSMNDIPVYGFDPAMAAELLESNDWTLNDEGIRSKNINGEEVVLSLRLAAAEGSDIGEAMRETFCEDLRAAGIELKVETVSAEELYMMFYRRTERDCDMILLSMNFGAEYEPSEQFDPIDAMIGTTNYSGIIDEELYEAALKMRAIEAGELFEYCTNWIEFQTRWLEVLPAMPLFSNYYYDFYSANLQNYAPDRYASWVNAISDCILIENGEETAK